MKSADVLADSLGREREIVHAILDGITPEQLTARLDPDANTVAWLVWHLARIQDSLVASVSGAEEVYTSQGWAGRFGLPFAADATGYGFTTDDVGAVDASAETLGGYFDAVQDSTLQFVATQTDAGLDRIIDRRWDPPVTAGARLVSVLEDVYQHLGQAAYVKGILQRRVVAPVTTPTTGSRAANVVTPIPAAVASRGPAVSVLG